MSGSPGYSKAAQMQSLFYSHTVQYQSFIPLDSNKTNTSHDWDDCSLLEKNSNVSFTRCFDANLPCSLKRRTCATVLTASLQKSVSRCGRGGGLTSAALERE